jgi:KDO2-lipid IV(A) lauroyltransferase
MKFVVREIDNERVGKLIESYRGLAGNKPIDKRNASRDILKALRNNETVGILVDQNTTRDEGVFADFFGILAATTPAIATLALRTGAAVVPGFLIWDRKTRKHRLHFDAAMEMIATGDPTRDIQENTAACNAVLEGMIRQYHDQWLWIHRRWKTRPQGEPGLYKETPPQGHDSMSTSPQSITCRSILLPCSKDMPMSAPTSADERRERHPLLAQPILHALVHSHCTAG